MSMLSNRPYLLRAFHQWIVDSGCVPILVLDATNPRCKIPRDYAEGGEIIFNVSPTAVRDFTITNDIVGFKASFSGVIHFVTAPIGAVLAIYAEENGEGLFLDQESASEDAGAAVFPIDEAPDDKPQQVPVTPPKGKPFLTLVD